MKKETVDRKSKITVPCKWCGTPTSMIGTKECEACWELRFRIKHHIGLARIMIKSMEAA